MGRPLAITKRQAASLLKAAEAEKGVVEVETPMGVVRLIPRSLVKDRDQAEDEVQGHF